MKIILFLALALSVLFGASPGMLFADTSQNAGQADRQDDRFFSDTPSAQHNPALDYLELSGMFAGTYLACRSDIMSMNLKGYSTSQFLPMVEKSGIALITAFAGTFLGGVTAAVAFGPVNQDYMQENNFNGGTRVLMVGFGAAAMAAGGYAGYRLGGNSPEKYGEEMIAGSIAGAIIGSYIGNLLGGIIFPDTRAKKGGAL